MGFLALLRYVMGAAKDDDHRSTVLSIQQQQMQEMDEKQKRKLHKSQIGRRQTSTILKSAPAVELEHLDVRDMLGLDALCHSKKRRKHR